MWYSSVNIECSSIYRSYFTCSGTGLFQALIRCKIYIDGFLISCEWNILESDRSLASDPSSQETIISSRCRCAAEKTIIPHNLQARHAKYLPSGSLYKCGVDYNVLARVSWLGYVQIPIPKLVSSALNNRNNQVLFYVGSWSSPVADAYFQPRPTPKYANETRIGYRAQLLNRQGRLGSQIWFEPALTFFFKIWWG